MISTSRHRANGVYMPFRYLFTVNSYHAHWSYINATYGRVCFFRDQLLTPSEQAQSVAEEIAAQLLGDTRLRDDNHAEEWR